MSNHTAFSNFFSSKQVFALVLHNKPSLQAASLGVSRRISVPLPSICPHITTVNPQSWHVLTHLFEWLCSDGSTTSPKTPGEVVQSVEQSSLSLHECPRGWHRAGWSSRVCLPGRTPLLACPQLSGEEVQTLWNPDVYSFQ